MGTIKSDEIDHCRRNSTGCSLNQGDFVAWNDLVQFGYHNHDSMKFYPTLRNNWKQKVFTCSDGANANHFGTCGATTNTSTLRHAHNDVEKRCNHTDDDCENNGVSHSMEREFCANKNSRKDSGNISKTELRSGGKRPSEPIPVHDRQFTTYASSNITGAFRSFVPKQSKAVGKPVDEARCSKQKVDKTASHVSDDNLETYIRRREVRLRVGIQRYSIGSKIDRNAREKEVATNTMVAYGACGYPVPASNVGHDMTTGSKRCRLSTLPRRGKPNTGMCCAAARITGNDRCHGGEALKLLGSDVRPLKSCILHASDPDPEWLSLNNSRHHLRTTAATRIEGAEFLVEENDDADPYGGPSNSRSFLEDAGEAKSLNSSDREATLPATVVTSHWSCEPYPQGAITNAKKEDDQQVPLRDQVAAKGTRCIRYPKSSYQCNDIKNVSKQSQQCVVAAHVTAGNVAGLIQEDGEVGITASFSKRACWIAETRDEVPQQSKKMKFMKQGQRNVCLTESSLHSWQQYGIKGTISLLGSGDAEGGQSSGLQMNEYEVESAPVVSNYASHHTCSAAEASRSRSGCLAATVDPSAEMLHSAQSIPEHLQHESGGQLIVSTNNISPSGSAMLPDPCHVCNKLWDDGTNNSGGHPNHLDHDGHHLLSKDWHFGASTCCSPVEAASKVESITHLTRTPAGCMAADGQVGCSHGCLRDSTDSGFPVRSASQGKVHSFLLLEAPPAAERREVRENGNKGFPSETSVAIIKAPPMIVIDGNFNLDNRSPQQTAITNNYERKIDHGIVRGFSGAKVADYKNAFKTETADLGPMGSSGAHCYAPEDHEREDEIFSLWLRQGELGGSWSTECVGETPG